MHKLLLTSSLAIALAAIGQTATAAEKSVTTSKTWLSGATTIYARMTLTGFSSTSQQGLCYSTQPNPTVDDSTSTAYLTNNGKIFKISDLQPATVYYVRAYAKSGSEVYYGNQVKAITRPGGSISYGVFGFSGDADTRVQAAAKQAVELWNEYTGIKGLYFNINYGSSTPTADCSYGGYMRIGPSSSYQATGTILHEGLHAIGVGTIGMWNNSSWMRGGSNSGVWRGVRVNRVIKFWDNDESATLKGDGTHMWPYGVNGAHEDNGSQVLYVGNSMLAEALGEDGLSPTANQFATPSYVFEQEDTVKYYIKNEKYGLGTSFLTEGKSKALKFDAMSSAQATVNDSAAWYVTFDPSTCYYLLKNVATGNYLTFYTSSAGTQKFKTKAISDPSKIKLTENFHFLPSCVDAISVDGYTLQGFWIANVTGNTATSLMLDTKEKVGAEALSFEEDASAQRWVILSANDLSTMDSKTLEASKNKLEETLKQIEILQAVSHSENIDGADTELASVVTSIKEKVGTATTSVEVETLNDEANEAIKSFLSKVKATDESNPFDITFFLTNPDLSSAEGWSTSPTISYGCGEFYQKTFDFNQVLSDMSAGVYELKAQGFQRPGSSADVYTAWSNGTDAVTANLYANSHSTKLCNIMVDAQKSKVGGTESTVATSTYIPNDMQAASLYFAKGLYENAVRDTLASQGTLKIGLKCTSSNSYYWTIFDNFRLYYFGAEKGDVTGIRNLNTIQSTKQQGIYNLSGTLISHNSSKLSTLPKGLYIVNGKKVIIK